MPESQCFLSMCPLSRQWAVGSGQISEKVARHLRKFPVLSQMGNFHHAE